MIMKSAIMFRVAILALCVLASTGYYDNDEADDETGGASDNSLTNLMASMVHENSKMLEDMFNSKFTKYKAFQEKCSQGDEQACAEAQLNLLSLQSLLKKYPMTVSAYSNLLSKINDVNKNIISNIRDTEPEEGNTKM
ncbi:unnamed protein product [Clavelina lepadiformis]|uniref:Uncharacterized protein n=1 Tax=Clavelina lepadiformis TaxID=159417 RepID=A0ABP0FRX6_CLALP